MLRLTWTENALEDLDWWQQHDAKMLKRIIQPCLEICKNPIQGIGKPEPLKFDLQGYWSRQSIALFMPLMKIKSLLRSVDFIIINNPVRLIRIGDIQTN